MPEYFTLAEFRLEQDMQDATRFPDALVERVAAGVVSTIERVVGTSFIGRVRTETVDTVDNLGHGYIPGSRGNANLGLVLSSPFVVSVTGATVGGVAVTDTLRTDGGVLTRYAAGTVYAGYWPRAETVVTYLAGYSAVPPADIKEAAIQATRARLLAHHSNAGVPDRATSVSNGDGTFNLTYAGPDHPFGYPEVDEVVIGWRDKLGGFGFA